MARENQVQNGWVVGLARFAGVVMIISGIFQLFEGLAAIVQQGYYVISHTYAFYLNVSTWGWINLIIGIVVTIVGFSIFSGKMWARVISIILVSISAIANFFYIPYYPIWAILIISLDIAVIWALSSYAPAYD